MGTKGERARAAVVDSARRLFYERGYDAASFSDIVAASGLQRGNIYHYFRSKDEILRAVVERYVGDFASLLAGWEAAATDPRARLLAFVRMLGGRRDDLVRYGCPIGSLNVELGKDRRDLQAAARAVFDLLRDWLAARFRELDRGADAEALALHLLGRAQGIAVLAQIYGDAALLARETDALAGWIERL